MATRQFNFIVGPETSTLPSIGTPSSDDDLISLGFADDRYTQGGESVADISALKGIASADRRDGDLFLVKSSNDLYRFDSASSASGDDNFVLVPTVGSGRWIKVTILNRANTFTDTTQSTTKDTGGAIFEGGVGIEKNLNVGGNVVVTGDLTVNGTTTTVSSTTLDVADANITVNKGGTVSSADSAVSGITIDTDATDARLGYDSTLASKFKAGNVGSESEIMTVGTTQTVSGAKTFSAVTNFTNTTQSTTKDNGGVVLEGGLGVEKNVNIGGNLAVTGDLTVSGTTTTVNSTTVDVVDPNITVNKGGSTSTANTAVAGFTVETSGTFGRLGYDSSLASRFKAGDSGSESEIITSSATQTISGAKTFSAATIFSNTTQSTDKDTGGVVLEGGLGVEKNLNVGGNFVVTGNLTVNGTTTTVNSTTLEVTDANITVNHGGNTASANSAVAGLTVEASDGTGNARIGYASGLTSRFKCGDSGSESEIITAAGTQTISGIKIHTNDLWVDNAKNLKLFELDANGSNYVGFKAPDSLSGDFIYTLPAIDGSSGNALVTNGSQVLSFAAVATDSLNQYNVKVGDGTNTAASVNTNTTGDILADSTNGLSVKKLITTDASLGSVTVASGKTLSHNSLNIQSGHTYTINGTLIAGNDLIVAGDLVVSGEVILTPTAKDGQVINTNQQTFSGVKNFTSDVNMQAATATTLTLNTINAKSSAGVLMQGATNGTAIAAGYIGEVITSAIPATNATATGNAYGDLTSITLTPGVWLITGHVRLDRNGSTSVAYISAGFGTISGNNGPNQPAGEIPPFYDFAATISSTGWNSVSATCSPHTMAVSSNTVLYLKALINQSSGTPQWMGRIRAIRIA